MYFSQLQLFISPLPSLLPLAFGHWASTDFLSSKIVYSIYLNISFPMRWVNKTQFVGKTRLITHFLPIWVFRQFSSVATLALLSSFTLYFGRRRFQSDQSFSPRWSATRLRCYIVVRSLRRSPRCSLRCSCLTPLIASLHRRTRVNFTLMDVKVRDMY